jgi:hypothetical protein
MAGALEDRWMPRTGVRLIQQRAANRLTEEKRAAAAQAAAVEQDARRARPGYDGDCPERMQGALRLK